MSTYSWKSTFPGFFSLFLISGNYMDGTVGSMFKSNAVFLTVKWIFMWFEILHTWDISYILWNNSEANALELPDLEKIYLHNSEWTNDCMASC